MLFVKPFFTFMMFHKRNIREIKKENEITKVLMQGAWRIVHWDFE
jgi:hypothetical protein